VLLRKYQGNTRRVSTVPRYAEINQDVAKSADDIGGCEDGIKGGGRIAGAGEKGVEIREREFVEEVA
jgi:hypothetical protein